MRIDPTELVIDSATEGADSLIANGGSPAAFFIVNLQADGLATAAVIDLIQTNTLMADSPKEVLSVQFSAAPGFLVGNTGGATVTIPFDDTLGTPPTQTLVVAGPSGTVPIQVSSVVDFIP